MGSCCVRVAVLAGLALVLSETPAEAQPQRGLARMSLNVDGSRPGTVTAGGSGSDSDTDDEPAADDWTVKPPTAASDSSSDTDGPWYDTAAACTGPQVDDWRAEFPKLDWCTKIFVQFGSCADNLCAQTFHDAALKAPDCSQRASGHIKARNVKNDTLVLAQKCDSVRAGNATGRYIPQPDPAAPVCVVSENSIDSKDIAKMQRIATSLLTHGCDPADATDTSDVSCSRKCRPLRRELVEAAPRCRQDDPSYSLHEWAKSNLARCAYKHSKGLASEPLLEYNAEAALALASSTPVASATAAPQESAVKSMTARSLDLPLVVSCLTLAVALSL